MSQSSEKVTRENDSTQCRPCFLLRLVRGASRSITACRLNCFRKKKPKNTRDEPTWQGPPWDEYVRRGRTGNYMIWIKDGTPFYLWDALTMFLYELLGVFKFQVHAPKGYDGIWLAPLTEEQYEIVKYHPLVCFAKGRVCFLFRLM